MVDLKALRADEVYADLSLVSIFTRIRKRWYVLAGTLGTFVLLGTLYAFLAAPVYTSSILLSPAEGGSSVGGSALRFLQGFGGGLPFFGGGRGQRNSRAIAISSLTSPFFTRAFIEENNLLPVLFADKWDAEKGEWAVDDPEDIPTLQEGYELFSSKVISVAEEDFGDLVTVTVSWDSPQQAADWANGIVADVNSRLRQQAIEDANLTIQYLNDELSKTNAVELQKSLYLLVESEIQKKTVAQVQKQYAFRVLSPAIAADIDKPSEPQRGFVISMAIALGLFFGLIMSLVADPISTAIKESRRSDQAMS